MSMETNLRGRLRNTSLPYSRGLSPLFEAVINSIHSIEERRPPSGSGVVTVEIVRDSQEPLDLTDGRQKHGTEALGSIVGFKILDDGIGFTDANMSSFLTLDSEYKADKGGRGVGRLLWLKAFQRVNVSSIYDDTDGTRKTRSFVFATNSGIRDVKSEVAPKNTPLGTSVHLDGFAERYRDGSPKSPKRIANALFEHCLWYFVRKGGAPKIIIKDVETVDLDNVYHEHMFSSAVTEQMMLKGREFDLTHVKLRMNSTQSHVIALCAANRLVSEESLTGRVPGLYGKLSDETGDFVYACYVNSSYLDEAVRPERTGFDIAENVGSLFTESEISLKEIREAVIAKVSEHLHDYLSENRRLGKERVQEFVSNRAPRYRPIMSRIPEEHQYVDPDINDRDLDLTLHRYLAEIEEQLLAEGHEIMASTSDEHSDEYKRRLQEYLRRAEDIKKSDLANYVSHRRVILDLLEKALKRTSDGKYVREDLIHSLIMPMRMDSNEVAPDSCNLWLLDERLAFHDYLASDKSLKSIPITDSADGKEPDILALNVFDNPILVSEGDRLPLASIVVVEIKRPMRNDATEGKEKDPIEQALHYLDGVRKGKVQTSGGRPIPNSANIPGFCYVICDITPTIEDRCRMHDAIRTSDGLGYFFYNKNFGAYVEVVSFDRLVNAAKERNRAFFDKLGLPTN